MKASPVLLLLGASLLIVPDPAITKYAKWHRLKNQAVREYNVSTSARSGIMCVGECMKHSQCDSCAYDRELGTCYLQVETDTTTDASVASVDVFTAFVPCDPARNLPNNSGTNITWRINGRGMDGDVICSDDYMNIGDSPTFRCSATGQWTVNTWECRQRIWRNPNALERLSVPKRPERGWTVCMTGYPTRPTRFSLNFEKDGGDRALHADFRFEYLNDMNELLLASKMNGGWMPSLKTSLSPFPFAVNRSFEVIVRAPTLFEIKVFVDDAFVGNYTTPISLDEVTKVFFNHDVNVDTLDLWCDQ